MRALFPDIRLSVLLLLCADRQTPFVHHAVAPAVKKRSALVASRFWLIIQPSSISSEAVLIIKAQLAKLEVREFTHNFLVAFTEAHCAFRERDEGSPFRWIQQRLGCDLSGISLRRSEPSGCPRLFEGAQCAFVKTTSCTAPVCIPGPCTFRNAAMTHLVTRLSRAPRFLHQRLLCSVPLSRNGWLLCLSRVHHEHNARLLAFASRIKTIDF